MFDLANFALDGVGFVCLEGDVEAAELAANQINCTNFLFSCPPPHTHKRTHSWSISGKNKRKTSDESIENLPNIPTACLREMSLSPESWISFF